MSNYYAPSMMSPEFANEKGDAVSKYHFPSLDTELFSKTFNNNSNNNLLVPRLAKQHRQQQRGPSQRTTSEFGRHVHFNEYNMEVDEQHHQQQQELEVSCEHNPTQLFLLMNRQLWDRALTQLHHKPIEAHVWISSFFPNSHEYKWCNLPLHLACLYGPEPAPLTFMEALIETYPGAAQCRNHEGNLPIHLACDCMDLSPKFVLEVEGILVLLIKAFPQCLAMRDSRKRRPIDILEEKKRRALNTERIVGRGVGIMKYMRAQARNMGIVDGVEQRHERDEDLTNRETKSRRRPRNREMPNNSRDETTTHRREKMEARDRSQSVSPRDARNGEVLHHREVHKREKMELRDISKSNSTIDTIEQNPPIVGKSFPFSPSNKSMHASKNHHQDDGPRDDRLATAPHPQQLTIAESPISPFNPMTAPTPQHSNVLRLATEHFDPFHQLDAELNSMRMTHQSMSNLLSTKTQSEGELLERLRKLEMKYAQLEKEHAELKTEHAGTIAEVEEKTKAFENSVYEIKVMKSKERAVSSELALKMEVEGRQHVELKQLKSELETVKEARNSAITKLDSQTKVNVDFKETNEKLKSENEILAKENEDMSKENTEMRAQLAQKNKLLQDAKRKESTLLEMLSKMHTTEDLEEAHEKGEIEYQKLSKEKEEFQKQLVELSKNLEETKTKELEWKTSTTKAKLEHKELTKKSEELLTQFAQMKEQLLEAETNESNLSEQLRKANERNDGESEKLSAQNIALRKIVDVLQRRVHQGSQSNDDNKDGLKLKRLLKDAESASIVGAGPSRKNRRVDISTSESLELLHPIINDARNLQEDTIETIQELLQKSYDTMELTGQISSIPHEKFAFDSTLHILENTITSHVSVLETLGTMLETKESCKSNLISLLNRQPLGTTKNRLTPTKNNRDEVEALSIAAISTVRDHTTKMSSITHKHVEKLESLSQTVSSLPKMKKVNFDSHKKDVRKHLSMVDEITSVLQKALSNLVQEAKQIKLSNQNIQIACAIEK